MITHSGFLLTRQWQDNPTKDSIDLIFWVITDNGAKKIRITQQKPVFFVLEKSQAFVRQLLDYCLPKNSWKISNLELFNFNGEQVSGVYFNQQRQLYLARSQLKENGLQVYESDITPTDRFLMERFLTGGIQFTAPVPKCTMLRSNEIIDPKLSPISFHPHYGVLSIDIETSLHGDRLYSIGLVYSRTDSPDQRKEFVYMVNEDPEYSPPLSQYLTFYPTETELLEGFLRTFSQLDPDIIIGWNVINFDLRFLQRKADQLHIKFCIGRELSVIDWRRSRKDSEHYTLTVPGRLVLDGIDTLKSATYNFESFSLEYVGNQVLKRGKLIDKDQDKGMEITRLFEADKLSLAAYNLEDCLLVWEIFVKLGLIDFAAERAQLTGLSMDRFGGSVASFDNRYLPRLHRKGYVAPILPENPQNVGSPGGYVMNSTPGIYNHVVVLDFKSLYPSIIQTFKIDPLGLVKGSQYSVPKTLGSSSQEFSTQETPNPNKAELVAGFNDALFSKHEHILPELISELWRARDRAKQQNSTANSQAIKILMNSFYGVLGTPGCRFFDHRLPSSITLRGHLILETTKRKIEEQGYQVIYGDTDSVFVWLKGFHPNIAVATLSNIGKELADNLNKWWSSYLRKNYDVENYLELEYETHFTRFIMPTIRGSEKGTKKRYAGLKATKDGKTKLLFKGLENVRTDWTLAARNFQQELYQRVFRDDPYIDFIQETVRDIYNGTLDKELVFRKRLRRKLSDYKKNIPPHVQAAHLAEIQRQKNNLPSKYQRGGWIEYLLTTSGPEPKEYITSPLNYDLYVERQIKPIADGILHFLGDSFESICSKQMHLL